MSWSRRVSRPVVLPNGGQLATLRDAGSYITSLPPADHGAKEWETAMHVLIQADDHGGPVEFARIGMLQALGRHTPRMFDTSRKDLKWNNRYKLEGSMMTDQELTVYAVREAQLILAEYI